LRERPRGHVEIDLDGVRWRLVPADAVVRAELRVGRPLDRGAARTLGRELRRAEALRVAARALRHRDLSRGRLEARLAERGATTAAAAAALDALEGVGLVDDSRVATTRAAFLASRGYGDAAIRALLEAERLDGGLIAAALAGLEPEPERARALLARRGGGPRALRWLAAHGFDEETLVELGGFAGSA